MTAALYRELTAIRRTKARRLFKLCSRCRRFFDWRNAAFLGYQQDDVERVELRNCSCGSTHGLVVAVAT